MTADIFHFGEARRRSVNLSLEDKVTTATIKLSNSQIFADVFEDIIDEWRKSAERNRLNEYVASKVPPSCQEAGADYLNDLNILSRIERRLKMQVATFSPGALSFNANGWISGFTLGSETFTTPTEMWSEATSRALLIVLYIRFKAVMNSIGRE